MARTPVLLLAAVTAASLGALAAGGPPQQLDVTGHGHGNRQVMAAPQPGERARAADPGAAASPSLPLSPSATGIVDSAPAISPAALSTVVQNDTATASALTADGIPAVAVRAYRQSEATLGSAEPGCHLSWSLVAAIGRVESNHGRTGGATLLAGGLSEPPVLGPLLDGQGFALIADTDHGRYDGNASFDRAVGPMQFLPGTWMRVGVDADHDGQADPFDITDAAVAAGSYLCADGRDLATPTGLQRAVFSYNHSDSYVALVIATARAYAAGRTDLPTVAPGPAVHVPAGPLPPATPTTPGTGSATVPARTAPSPAPSTAPARSNSPAPISPAPPPSRSAPPTSSPSTAPSPSTTPSSSATPSPSTTPSPTATPSPTCSPVPTPSGTPSPTPTGSPIAGCPMPSATPTPTSTPTPSPTSSGATPPAPSPVASVQASGSVQPGGSVTSASTAALTVSWSAASGATHYLVRLFRLHGTTRIPVGAPVSVAGRSHSFTPLPLGGTYLATLSAAGSAGPASATITTVPVRLLAPPQVTVAADGRTLQWVTPAGQPAPSSWLVTVVDTNTGAVRPSTSLPGKARTYDLPLAIMPKGHRYEVIVQATYDDTVGIAGRATAPTA